MSDAKKCDRCHKLYEITTDAMKQKYSLKYTCSYGPRILDLCGDCYDKLTDWVYQGAKEEETDETV